MQFPCDFDIKTFGRQESDFEQTVFRLVKAHVPELEENIRSEKGLTLREQMQQHSEDVRCATCHSSMDPLGFALENFNAIGLWRAKEHGKLIQTAGKLPTGESFDGGVELQRLLARVRRESFVRCAQE